MTLDQDNFKCYDCGTSLIGVDRNLIDNEHIPAKCLFKGFESDFTHDLITVKALKTHNNSYSSMDDELRNFVAILTDGKQNQEMLVKTFSSITRKNSARIKSSGRVISFDYEQLLLLNEKNFKGLFYKTYRTFLSLDKYKLFAITEGEKRNKLIEFMWVLYQKYLKNMLLWNISGHEDVFRYKIIGLKQEGNDLVETNQEKEMVVILCAMHYYKTVLGYCVAIQIDWAQQFLPKEACK